MVFIGGGFVAVARGGLAAVSVGGQRSDDGDFLHRVRTGENPLALLAN